MGFRLSEEEAIELGLRKDKNGDWHSNNDRRRAGDRSRREVGASVRHDPPPRVSDLERNPRREDPAPVSDSKVYESSGKACDRFRIIVTVYCSRKEDSDNVYPKHFIDLLIRAGIMPDDSSKWVASTEKKIEQVQTKEEERTIIEIYKLCSHRLL